MNVLRKLNFSGLWLLFLFFYFTYKVSQKAREFPIELSFIGILSILLACLFLYFLSVGIVKSKLHSKVKVILLCLLAGLYSILGFYHYKASQNFDFSILADHWTSLWRPGTFTESLKVVESIFGPADYFRTFIAVLIMYCAVLRDRRYLPQKKSYAFLIAAVAAFFSCLLVPNPVDEFASFGKSAALRVFSIERPFQAKYKPKYTENLPLISKFNARHGSSVKPHVFFVFIESVNARFIEAKSPDGKEYTPFFNSLIKEGMYFERFYAQSIQTGRSHFVSLCGLTPSVYGKEFKNFIDRKLNCLPQLLSKNGYFTVFSKANEDVNFDNTYAFTTAHGFSVMNSMGKGCKGADKDICWGWGIPDDVFYKRFFDYLKRSQGDEAPLFATLATISSHMPFNEVPASERYIYKNPSNRLEYYSNALRITDEYLKTFFQELKRSPYYENSVVFLMGDHSFPMGEHGNFQNETFAFEENFRTPLLIIDNRKNRVVPVKRVKEAYSQINLPATVLDLVGISTETHFQGNSLLDEKPSYIHLIQPYGGLYLSVIQYPFKYIIYDRTGKEYIYDLAKDPNEQNNLFAEWKDTNLLENFRREVGRIWYNYDLMVQDRVWKNSSSGMAAINVNGVSATSDSEGLQTQ